MPDEPRQDLPDNEEVTTPNALEQQPVEPQQDAEPDGGDSSPAPAEPDVSDSAPAPVGSDASDGVPAPIEPDASDGGTYAPVEPDAGDDNPTPAEQDGDDGSPMPAEPDASGGVPAPAEPEASDNSPAPAPAEPQAPQTDDGTILHRPAQDQLQVTMPMPSVTAPLPQPTPSPEATPSEQAPTTDSPRLKDVGTTFVRWLRTWIQATKQQVAQHRITTIAIGLACVAALAVVALLNLKAHETPSDEQIISDASAQLSAPAHAQSPYLPDEPLSLQSITVVEKERSQTRKDACDVEVVATYSNEHIETRAEGQLTYVKGNDGWTCSAAAIDKSSHYAKTGVVGDLVLANVGDLLAAADTNDDRESLVSLYRDANLTLAREEFDEEKQTEDITIHCTSSGTFVSYACDLDAHLRFVPASGAWELASASVSNGAKDLGFDPLIGTWTGTFASQSSTSYKCLAAQAQGISITITKANMLQDGGASIEGTVTGTAHLHPDLRKDADSTDGDLLLDETPFTGQLAAREVTEGSFDWLLRSGDDPAGIVFECSLPDVANGSVTLTLELGSATAPDVATATLTTRNLYEDSILLFMRYTREAVFADTFTLEKAS